MVWSICMVRCHDEMVWSSSMDQWYGVISWFNNMVYRYGPIKGSKHMVHCGPKYGPIVLANGMANSVVQYSNK